MIISNSRSRTGSFLDTLLTIIGWMVFIYLFGAGILAILRGAVGGPQAPLVPTFLPTLATLSTYAIIALFNAAILICWAYYNHRRFAGVDRRKPLGLISAAGMARSFSVTEGEVGRLRTAKVLTVHHNAKGDISASFVGHKARWIPTS